MDWRRIRSRFLDWIWSDWMSWGTRREDGGRGLSWEGEKLGWYREGRRWTRDGFGPLLR